jgi:hypothetical protein
MRRIQRGASMCRRWAGALLAASLACHGRSADVGQLPTTGTVPRDAPVASPSSSASAVGPEPAVAPTGLDSLDTRDRRDREADPEDAYIEKTLPRVPSLDLAPRFVAIDLLLRTVPRDSRDRVGTFEGDWIDDAQSRFLLRYQWGAVQANLLIVSSRGALLGVLRFEDRTPRVALKDVVGDRSREIIVQVIRGNVLEGGPQDWEIYDATGRKIASVEQTGSWPDRLHYPPDDPSVRYFRRLDFPRKGHMTVETVSAGGDLPCGCAPGCPPCRSAPPRAGDREEYEYAPKSGRFVKVSESRGPPAEFDCRCGAGNE